MDLSVKELKRISILYSLGKVKKIKEFKEGWVNHNFLLETEKGKYVVQISGRKKSHKNMQRRNFQLEVLFNLEKNNFPYSIPKPLRNSQNNYFFSFKRKSCWIYPYIPGRIYYRLSNKKLEEVGKALAKYHLLLKNYKPHNAYTSKNEEYIEKQFKKISKSNKKGKIDILVKNTLPLINNQFSRLKNNDFKMNILPCHTDINQANLIFNKDNLIGIIDFDNVSLSPRVRDVSSGIRNLCNIQSKHAKIRIKALLKGYESVWPLSKKEKKKIIPFIILQNCNVFCWLYTGFTKYPKKKYSALKKTIDENKLLASKKLL